MLSPHPEGIGRIKTTVANGNARLSDLHAIMEARGGGSLRCSLNHLTEIFKKSSEYLDLSTKSRQGYDYCAAKACGYLLHDGRRLGEQRVEQLSVPVLQRAVETLATGRPAIGKLPGSQRPRQRPTASPVTYDVSLLGASDTVTAPQTPLTASARYVRGAIRACLTKILSTRCCDSHARARAGRRIPLAAVRPISLQSWCWPMRSACAALR